MADTARNRQSGSVAERRRALTVLGDNPDGCTQAILLAHGFRSQLLAELVRTKLVTEHYERVMHCKVAARSMSPECGLPQRDGWP